MLDLDHLSMPLDELGQALDRRQRPLDLLAAAGGELRALPGRPRGGVRSRRSATSRNCWRSWSPALRTSSSRRRAGERGGPALDLGPGLAARLGGLGLGLLVGIERREHRFEFGDTCSLVRRRAPVSSAIGSVEPFEFGLELAPLAERPGQPLGRGGEPGVVLVELAGERALRPRVCGRVRRERRRAPASASVSARAARSACSVASVERRGGRSAGRRSDPPPGRGEAIARRRHDDRIRMRPARPRSRRRDRRPGRPADERGEQAREIGAGSTARAGAPARRPTAAHRCRPRTPAASTAPLVSDSSSALSARCADTGPSTTTAVSASPSAASTASCQPSSISTRSSSVPSTPSTSASRSAPARSRAASSASCSASTRAVLRDACSDASWRSTGAPFERRFGGEPGLLGCFDLRDERRLDRFGLCAVGAQSVGFLGELLELRAGVRRRGSSLAADRCSLRCRPVRIERSSPRTSAAALAALAPPSSADSASVIRSRSTRNAASSASSASPSGATCSRATEHLVQLGTEPGAVGFEIGDHAGVDQLAVVAFERPLALGEDARQPPRSLTELLDLHQPVAEIAGTAGRQFRLHRHDLGVELRELRLELAVDPRPLRSGRWRSLRACDAVP